MTICGWEGMWNQTWRSIMGSNVGTMVGSMNNLGTHLSALENRTKLKAHTFEWGRFVRVLFGALMSAQQKRREAALAECAFLRL
jgi:hypothetical protein